MTEAHCPTCNHEITRCAYCEKMAVVFCDCVTEIRTQRIIEDINGEWKTCDRALCEDHRTIHCALMCFWETVDLCPEHKDRVKPLFPLWIGDMSGQERKDYERSLLSQQRKESNIISVHTTTKEERR